MRHAAGGGYSRSDRTSHPIPLMVAIRDSWGHMSFSPETQRQRAASNASHQRRHFGGSEVLLACAQHACRWVAAYASRDTSIIPISNTTTFGLNNESASARSPDRSALWNASTVCFGVSNCGCRRYSNEQAGEQRHKDIRRSSSIAETVGPHYGQPFAGACASACCTPTGIGTDAPVRVSINTNTLSAAATSPPSLKSSCLRVSDLFPMRSTPLPTST